MLSLQMHKACSRQRGTRFVSAPQGGTHNRSLAEDILLSHMEIFSNIESQIERAVQLGQDKVVQALDRQIDPVLEDILKYRATNTLELHKQLKFITDLLVRRSDDAATVVRLSAKLSEMISTYFQDGQLRFPNPLGVKGLAPVMGAVSETPPAAEALEVARVAVISMDYRFLYCNTVMAADLQLTSRQLVGRPITDFCSLSVLENDYQAHIDMCLAGSFREFKAPCLTGRNSLSVFRVRLTPLRNIERRITGAVLVAQKDEMVAVEH